MRNLESTDGIDTPNGTSRRSLFRKALAAAAAVAGTGVLLDLSKRTARAEDGDPLTVGNTALLGPDTSSNTTQLDKDNLNAGPTLVLTNQNGDGLVSSGAANSAGVSGLGESGPNGTGVFGRASAVGVYGQGPTGVLGQAGASGKEGVRGEGPTGVLGLGTGASGQGVRGEGPKGVVGVGTGTTGEGVRGEGYRGVRGVSTASQGTGVYAESTGANSAGVFGFGTIGVFGQSSIPRPGVGVHCVGDFVATGTKSAAVPHPDGSHRLLYCMESPENWFEDFGSAALAGGRASVTLDPDFAAVVNTADYRVFLTPEGDSRGLYVSSKSATGFTVREQQGGTSSLAFSYRVVARRKDVEAGRLAKFSLPALPTPTDVGRAVEAARRTDLPPLEPSQVSALPPTWARRR